MKCKTLVRIFLIATLCHVPTLALPQNDWVWGKSGGSGSVAATGSGGLGTGTSGTSSGFANNGASSGTVLNFASNPASNSGTTAAGDNVVITSQSTGANKPTVIVQVLQPGSTTVNGLNTIGTNSNASSSSPASRGAVPADGEARLFPRVHRLFQSAIQNIVSGNNANSGNGVFGNGLLNALFGFRNPTTTSAPISSSNDQEFNTEGSGGSLGSIGSSTGGSDGGSSFLGGQNCRCISSDACRLPSVDKGPCSGGIMCCRSSGTRTVGGSGSSSNTRTPSVRFSPGDLRVGLFEEIVRGGGNVVDNAIDFIFAPYLTQEDQQNLATRIGGSRISNSRKG